MRLMLPTLWIPILEALESILDGFRGIAMTDPLGVNVDYAEDAQVAADELEIEVGTIDRIV